MTSEFADHFVSYAAFGGGLLLIGTVTLLAGGRLLARVAITLGVIGLATAAAAFVGGPADAVRTVSLLSVTFTVTGLVESARVADAVAWARRAFTRPVVRSGVVAAAGLLTVFGSAVAYDQSVNAPSEAAFEAIRQATTLPDRHPVRLTGATDRGGVIELLTSTTPRSRAELVAAEEMAFRVIPPTNGLIRHGPADDTSNCFGWVFAGGRHWVSDRAVLAILGDNGYRAVTDPRPGDLVVYRSPADDRPTHAAVVRYVTEGLPVLVEGKWGWMGVYVHEVDRSGYGTNYAYYRSPRPGHALLLPHDSDPHHLTGAE